MKTTGVIGVAALLATCLCAATAFAQFHAYSEDVQLYAGELFGDRLAGTSISGKYPQLNDSFTLGGRYTLNFTPQWGLQLSAGYSPSRATRLASGSSDFAVTTADLDVIWDIAPDFTIESHKLVPYAVLGGGYAWANLNEGPLSGAIQETPVVLRAGNGITGNAGFGVKYYVTEQFFIDLDGRYRYLNNLISAYGEGLNTVETTLGFGFRF
jgi:opacity protein-like surface antigen